MKSEKKNKKEICLIDLNSVPMHLSQKYIIFGAGAAGTAIAWYLRYIKKIDKYAFCDNDVNKQSHRQAFPVFSVEETLKQEDAVYFIGFMGNDEFKLMAAETCLKEKGVDIDRIILIDMQSNWFDNTCEVYTEYYIKSLYHNRHKERKIDEIDKIVFLTGGFSSEVEKKGGGGPIGAICMQKRYLGNKYGSISLKYPYYEYSTEPEMIFNKYWDITGTIDAVDKITKREQSAIYIANDMFSAFALYILGKNYCLIFHGQGDLVQEWTLWGRDLTKKEKELLYEIEYVTIKNALIVSFPSIGAKWFFEQSLNKPTDFKCSFPLYNTVYDFQESEKVDGIERQESKITFLSIGQFTWLKGMDRIPDFLERYIQDTDKIVRWIVVADGVLKEEVEQSIKLLQKCGKLEYINIDHKVSHAQIFYLMNLCDVYLMLHRVSIFDFSTLEAMCCGKAVILSNIPGNDEYNKENNIMLVEDPVEWDKVCNYIDNGIHYGNLNKSVYEQHFSEKIFVQRYHRLFDELIISVKK